jgi:phospholipase/lecithinase/hemolysin
MWNNGFTNQVPRRRISAPPGSGLNNKECAVNKKKLGMLCLTLGLFLSVVGSAFAHSAYSRLIVFGDSLSDPGNAYLLTGQLSVPPYSLIPDAPYAVGNKHFSNGSTWAEVLAKGLQLGSGPAYADPVTFSNFAVGGGRARSVTGVDLSDQVGLYLSSHAGTADPDALYAIMIGGNDIRDAIAAFQVDPSGATSAQILQSAVTSVANNIQSLAVAGARHFLISNAPNLALVPAVTRQGPLAEFVAQMLSTQYNGGLESVVASLTRAFSLDVAQLDMYNLLQSLVAVPQRIGLENVTETCIHPGVSVDPQCEDPDDYLFWDGIHPTHTVHKFLARKALLALHVGVGRIMRKAEDEADEAMQAGMQ